MMRKKLFLFFSKQFRKNKRLVLMIQSLKINKIYFVLPIDQIISCGEREKKWLNHLFVRDNMLSMFKRISSKSIWMNMIAIKNWIIICYGIFVLFYREKQNKMDRFQMKRFALYLCYHLLNDWNISVIIYLWSLENNLIYSWY